MRRPFDHPKSPTPELEIMTLLHSISTTRIPGAVGSLAADWPTGTTHTDEDILVRGMSLAAAARVGGTPLVRIARARAWSPLHRGDEEFLTIVVTAVEHVDHLGLMQRPDVWIDAAIGGCVLRPSTARIIGRRTDTRRRRMRVLNESAPESAERMMLPADLRRGDLLAVACSGTIARSAVSPRVARRIEQDGPGSTEEPDELFYGRCGR